MSLDVYMGVERFRSRNPEIDLFGKFLDEEFNTDQLSFYLCESFCAFPYLLSSLLCLK